MTAADAAMQAARMGDPVQHKMGKMLGMIGGAIVGAGLIALTIGTGGAALPFIIGAGAVGGMAGAKLGSLFDFGVATGAINPICSHNVFIGCLPAARASVDTAFCSGLKFVFHFEKPLTRIAEGSSNVFINGHHAARQGDRVQCSANIRSGMPNVFIGGGTSPVLEIEKTFVDYVEDALPYVAILSIGFGAAILLLPEAIVIAAVWGAVIGAIIAGGLEIGTQLWIYGKIIDPWAVIESTFKWAIIGGISGGVGQYISAFFALEGLSGIFAKMVAFSGVGFLEGFGTSIVEQISETIIDGTELPSASVLLKQALFDGGIGAIIGIATLGIGGWFARRARKAKEAIEQAVETGSRRTDDIIEQSSEAAEKVKKHLESIENHKNQYIQKRDEAISEGKTNSQIGGYKSKITEAIGEEATTYKVMKDFPDAELAQGFEVGQGYDQIWEIKNEKGEIVEYIIVEAKGPGAKLSTGAKKGDQMSKEWILNTAEEMSDKGQELGEKILDAIEDGPPPKITAKGYEAVVDESGNILDAKPIDLPDGEKINYQ